MITSVIGILVGTGLFVGGFVFHDINYKEGGSAYHLYDGHSRRYIIGSPVNSGREDLAYVAGTVGAVCLAISVKRAWNQRKAKSPTKSDRAYGKFRIMHDLITGGTLWIVGGNLHDSVWKNDGLTSTKTLEDNYGGRGWRPYQNWSHNKQEHFGYVLGSVGMAWLSLSAKQAWTQWEPHHLNRAYEKFRKRVSP